jgi:hypothetical protein
MVLRHCTVIIVKPYAAIPKDRPRSTMKYLYEKIRFKGRPLDRPGSSDKNMSWEEPPLPTNLKRPRYQWFWVGNQEETEVLTPDLRHTVKRHIMVKRVIKDAEFPVINIDGSEEPDPASPVLRMQRSVRVRRRDRKFSATPGNGFQQPTLEDLLDFSFCVQVGFPPYLG